MMNPTHIHLMLNHFPIIGTLMGSAVMLFGIVKKQNSSKAVGAIIIVIMAVIAIPVMLTGEPAEESIKQLSGISKPLIHDHEEAAEKAFWMMEITGAFSLTALILNKIKSALASKAFWIAFAFSVITFFTMVWTGNLGGKIRHPEKSNTVTNVNKNATESQSQKGK